jgi:predicted GNAT family N-acyltransferase
VPATWEADRIELQRIRRMVFIEEQQVSDSDEWDDDDAVSAHVLVRLNRDPVGTGRLNPAGKIGRIAVIAGARGRGIRGLILRHLLDEARRRGIRRPYLHAQLQALPFYEKLGFRSEGGVFDEAGLPHVRMRFALE